MRTSNRPKEGYTQPERRASAHGSSASLVAATLCILVYIGAIAFGVVQLFITSDERRSIAEAEFDQLADQAAASTATLGFGSKEYRDAIGDFLVASTTLEGVIISSSGGDYDTFERAGENVINREGETPRFRTIFGNAREPLHRPLMIEGQRNVTIQAVYSLIDHDKLIANLKITLIAILGGLALAFLTLILETAFNSRKPRREARRSPALAYTGSADQAETDDFEDIFEAPQEDSPEWRTETEEPPQVIEIPPVIESSPAGEEIPEPAEPKGLFSPRGNIGWETYTRERLASELHRCAAFEQDLTFIVMESSGPMSDEVYRSFADEAVSFFTQRDMVFERGPSGVSIIVPNAGLEEGLAKSGEFYNCLRERTPEAFAGGADLSIGISSRSGRLVDAGRLMLEAGQALKRALTDTHTRIVAFKSDPEKYRDFLRRRQS